MLAATVVTVLVGSITLIVVTVGDLGEDPKPLEDIVTAISRESAALTDLYFYVAEASAEIVSGSVILADGAFEDPAILNTMRRVVDTHSNVNGASIGLPNGDFLFVTRSLATTEGGFREKFVRDADAPTRIVTEQQFDARFVPATGIARLDDDYDPRTRPWYVGALEQGSGWTEPYVFASSAEPGITYFMAVRSETAETLAVIGIDLELREIDQFLQARRPGPNGAAEIVSKDGLPIAGSGAAISSDLLPRVLRAADTGDTAKIVSASETANGLQVASVEPVGTQRQWTLTVVAAEADFPQTLASRIEGLRRLVPLVGILLALLVAAGANGAIRRINRLDRAATTDSLTGLLNRVEVRHRLAALLDSSPDQRIAVLAIDLDGARAIGARWGHEMEEACIQVMTARLAEHIGDDGFAGRLEGNEFLAAWVIDADIEPFSIVRELVDALTEPSEALGSTLLPDSIACGFAVREPGEDIGLVTMLRNTDLALLTARSQMENVVRFDPEMELPSVRDQHRRSEMLLAIERNEFEVHFQPEVRLSDARVVGAEALLRWRQKEHCYIPAKDFIDDIERLEVIDLLSPLVFKAALRLAAESANPEFTIRINCCANQLANKWLLGAIAHAQQTTIANWCIEITERTIVMSDDDTLAGLNGLIAAGVTLALDDFGTGYSSFVELQNLPITTVKIDRSLVKSLTIDGATTSLAALIHDMAERLSLDVIAEGIETEDQRAALAAIGCTNGQGWLFGAAVPGERFPHPLTQIPIVATS